MAVLERRAAVRDMAGQGLTNREIGRVLGVHHDTVGADLRKGVDAPAKQPRPIVPFKERIERNVQINPATGCWEWTGSILDSGYVVVHIWRDGIQVNTCAHRASYEEHVGPIPDGYDLDHVCHTESQDCPGGKTCRHRACVNPDHLEPVTRQENVRRSRRWSERVA